ncbi:MAG: ABC transporter ATP-binding protein [Terriglobia bacterium]
MIEAKISKNFPAGPDSSGFHLNVEFEAGAGLTVLFGPSGAGKTLTLDAIAGFVAPDAGRILLDGRILFDAEARVHIPPQQRGCGYVFQNYALFPHMTLRQNLAFAAHAMPRLEAHRRIGESLDRFQLTDLAGRFPGQLSGGQKQRVSIARALIAQPKVLLLDEPARGLDTASRRDFYRLVVDMKKSIGAPILLVTHDIAECLALADRVMVYHEGKILHQGVPLELLRNPGTAVVARLLGGFNIYEADILSLDPVRQTSRIRMLGNEFEGPHLRGCFKGDRVTLCARPEELRIAVKPGHNRIRRDLVGCCERQQAIRADFGSEVVVDVPRDQWTGPQEALWVEIPAAALRLLK